MGGRYFGRNGYKTKCDERRPVYQVIANNFKPDHKIKWTVVKDAQKRGGPGTNKVTIGDLAKDYKEVTKVGDDDYETLKLLEHNDLKIQKRVKLPKFEAEIPDESFSTVTVNTNSRRLADFAEPQFSCHYGEFGLLFSGVLLLGFLLGKFVKCRCKPCIRDPEKILPIWDPP